MNALKDMARRWFRRTQIRTEPEDMTFGARLDRISNLITYEQPLDSADPLEVVAAQLRMAWDR